MTSIRELSLQVGVELTSRVREGHFKAERVHEVLHELAEEAVECLGLSQLALVVGSNPELLGKRIAFKEVDGPISVSLRNNLKWSIIEECAGYRSDNEAYIIDGSVLDSLRQFADRLGSYAERGALNPITVGETMQWVGRLLADGRLEGVEFGMDVQILKPRIDELGMFSSRIRARMAAAAGIPKEKVVDPLLDQIDNLSFLAVHSTDVLIKEIREELKAIAPATTMAR